MRHVIVWSGGFDSTLLIDIVASRIFGKGAMDDKILLVSFCCPDIVGNCKTQRELNARSKILQTILKDGKYRDIEVAQLTINNAMDGYMQRKNYGLAQPILWASMLVPNLCENDIVYMGYIKDDQATNLLPSIQKMLSAMSNLSYPDCAVSATSKINFEFPLILTDKSQVLQEVYKMFDEKVFDACTCCEHIHMEDYCGNCVPCKHLKSALLNASVEDPDNSSFYLSRLSKWFDLDVDITKIPLNSGTKAHF